MPLPQSLNRKKHHTRKIVSEGYERDDGLWEVEARMTDAKTYAFQNEWRGEITPDQFLHDISVRLVLDDHFEIKDIHASIDSSPFQLCPQITDNFKSLIGLKLTKGFRKQALVRIGGRHGCTHIVELLPVLATTAFQSIYPIIVARRGMKFEDADVAERPFLLNSCHIFADDGEMVRTKWPRFYKDPAEQKTDETDETS